MLDNKKVDSPKAQKSLFSVIANKYRGLLVIVVAFFMLIIGIVAVTYFLVLQARQLTAKFEMVGQQSILVHELSDDIYNVSVYWQEAINNAAIQELVGDQVTDAQSPNQVLAATPSQGVQPSEGNAVQATTTEAVKGIVSVKELPQAAIYRLDNIKRQRQTLEGMIKVLDEDGGEVTLIEGDTTVVQGITEPHLRMHIDHINKVWVPYAGLLDNLLSEINSGTLSAETVQYAVEYTRLYNHNLRFETDNLQDELSLLIQDNTRKITLVQMVGALLAFILFLGLVFGSLRQLARTDTQLEIAKQQTDDIMKTVNEGLFLVDKDLVIADQYSAKLEQILRQTNIAGRTLYDILEGMISQKDMETTKMFVDQLYNSWVVEELIQDLNPLKQVLVSYIDDDGVGVTQFLEFNFLRVMDDKREQIESVFVSVVDVTNEVHLQAQMQKDKEQHNRQIEMISYLLSVDGRQLMHFISETKARIERMNDVLKDRGTGNLREKAEQLYRETHSLKGDASAVNLGALVGIAEKQEDKLKTLLSHGNLKGNDFLPFTVGLDEMVSMMTFIESLVQRLNLQEASIALNLTEETPSVIKTDGQAGDDTYWQEYFGRYADDIARRQGKEVRVDVQGFDGLALSDKQKSIFKDIAVQLLKNAIVHGIEPADERQQKGKTAAGLVTINLVAQGDDIRLQVRDDGAGINWGKLREKAITDGVYSASEAANLQSKDLLRLMFKSGLSTADKQDEDAGRGVGMDIVKELANQAGGKIGVNSRTNQFTQINVTFPK